MTHLAGTVAVHVRELGDTTKRILYSASGKADSTLTNIRSRASRTSYVATERVDPARFEPCGPQRIAVCERYLRERSLQS